MPGGSGPVQLARLPDLSDGAFRAFVRFSAGWARPGPGHYPVAEELLLLEGDLELSGHAFGPGAYGWLQAGWRRSGMHTRAGCLAFAWFTRAPRWIPGEPADACAGEVILKIPEGCVYRGPEHETWIVPRPRSALPSQREILGLRTLEWRQEVALKPGDDPAEAVLLRAWPRR
jgi:hypothetical protein